YFSCFFAISPRGTTNWIAQIPGAMYAAPVIGPDGTIYLGCSDGELWAMRPDGTVAWRWTPPPYSPADASSVAVGLDGALYFYVYLAGYQDLFSLHPDKTTNWMIRVGRQYGTGPIQHNAPVIGPDGTIYVSPASPVPPQSVYGLSPSGTTNWVVTLPATSYGTPAIGPDGTLYLGAEDHKLYAFDPLGRKKWEFLASSYIECSPALLEHEGLLVFGDGGGTTYALDTSGAVKWSVTTGGVSASPLALDDGSVLVCSFSSNSVYALSASGSILWTFAAPGRIYGSPVVAADGTIYVAAGTNLCALYSTNHLANTAWPMFLHDPRHSGRATQRSIQPPRLLADGNVALTMLTETGLTYSVECSTDLLDWSQLATFSTTAITNEVMDLHATNFPVRYYRLATETP
ncbi:MAG: PQQ-binding-like beta-propeller repeat protein, partial [Limisphaerales bacterium]